MLPGAPNGQGAGKAAAVALVTACGDMPAAVWTTATVAEGLRTFEWFPPPAKVHALLLPLAETIRRTRDGLRRIICQAAETASTPKQDKGPHAQEFVAGIDKAFAAERSWNAPGTKAETRTEARPSYPTPEQLAATRHTRN